MTICYKMSRLNWWTGWESNPLRIALPVSYTARNCLGTHASTPIDTARLRPDLAATAPRHGASARIATATAAWAFLLVLASPLVATTLTAGLGNLFPLGVVADWLHVTTMTEIL